MDRMSRSNLMLVLYYVQLELRRSQWICFDFYARSFWKRGHLELNKRLREGLLHR